MLDRLFGEKRLEDCLPSQVFERGVFEVLDLRCEAELFDKCFREVKSGQKLLEPFLS